MPESRKIDISYNLQNLTKKVKPSVAIYDISQILTETNENNTPCILIPLFPEQRILLTRKLSNWPFFFFSSTEWKTSVALIFHYFPAFSTSKPPTDLHRLKRLLIA